MATPPLIPQRFADSVLLADETVLAKVSKKAPEGVLHYFSFSLSFFFFLLSFGPQKKKLELPLAGELLKVFG